MEITLEPHFSGASTTIDNAFLTLRPGTTFVYENTPTGKVDSFVVTAQTKVIDGVTCVAVQDTARVNGAVLENTIDWSAQDDAGNVRYFGENSHHYEPGNPKPVGHAGSWQAGVDGATAGIAMLADPNVGDHDNQENAPGIAEDQGAVVALGKPVSVVYGAFDAALVTADTFAIEPGIEHKYNVAGIGNVLTTLPKGDFEALTKIIVDGTSESGRVLGDAGGDHRRSLTGSDTLKGLAGNDTMSGGQGQDALSGDHGFDRLNGDAGSDVLTGGAGGDVFVFRNLHDGHADTDTTTDYRFAEVDALDLSGGLTVVASGALVGGVWKLTGDGDLVRLIGVADTDGNGHITDNLLFACNMDKDRRRAVLAFRAVADPTISVSRPSESRRSRRH